MHSVVSVQWTSNGEGVERGYLMRQIVSSLTMVGLLVGLTGCFQNPLEAAVEGAIKKAVESELAESGAEFDYGTNVDLPADWPSSVPIPDGDLITALSSEGTHSIVITVASVEAAEAGVQKILDSGFSVEYEQTMAEGMRSWGLVNAEYMVMYLYIDDGESVNVNMTVGPASQ
jgi:hypothetical protein